MRLVIIESPFRPLGGYTQAETVAYARAAVRDSLSHGEAPLAPHLLYTQPGILDDCEAEAREEGMRAGWAWYEARRWWGGPGVIPSIDCLLPICAVYADLGISSGMDEGMDYARSAGCAVDVRYIGTDAPQRLHFQRFPPPDDVRVRAVEEAMRGMKL